MERHEPSGISAASPVLHPGPVPRLLEAKRNGLPETVPYAYRGSGTDDDWDGELTGREWLEAAIWAAMRRHGVTTRHPTAFADDIIAAIPPVRWREATALDDPYLRYAGVPVSAPAGWIRDFEEVL